MKLEIGMIEIIILLSEDQIEALEILESLRNLSSEELDTLIGKLLATAQIKRKLFDISTLSFESSQKALQTLISNFGTN